MENSTYRSRSGRTVPVLLLLSVIAFPVFPQEVIRVRDYFPLVVGSEWVFRDEFGVTDFLRVGPGSEFGFGSSVKYTESAPFVRQLYRVNSNGIFWIRGDDMDDELGRFRISFNPELKLADADMFSGQSVSTNGTVTAQFFDFSVSATLNYTSTATLNSSPPVSVPAGTFDVVRLSLTLNLSGEVEGEQLNETVSEVYWLAKFIGPVMSEFDGVRTRLINVDSDGDGIYNTADADIDGDGIPNSFENARAGLNPLNPADAGQDPDGDGLSNLREFQLGTDLSIADSDGDGVDDGTEIARGTNPLLDEDTAKTVLQLLNSILMEDDG